MQQRDWVAVLIGLGALLTIVGPFIGVRALIKEHRGLNGVFARLKEISEDANLSEDERQEQRHAVRKPTSTWGDLEYFREVVRFYVLDQARSNLGLAAVLTVLGIVMGAVAGIWSLYLPT